MNSLSFSLLPWKYVSVLIPGSWRKKNSFNPKLPHPSWSWFAPFSLHLTSLALPLPLSCGSVPPPYKDTPCAWLLQHTPASSASFVSLLTCQFGHLFCSFMSSLSCPVTCSMNQASHPSWLCVTLAPSSFLLDGHLDYLLPFCFSAWGSALNSKGYGDDLTFRTRQKSDKSFPRLREMAEAGLPGKFLWAGVLFSRMTTHSCHF